MQQKIGNNSIHTILTLRYDINQKSSLPSLNSKSFTEHCSIDHLNAIEKYIIQNYHSLLNINKRKNVSLALSGGIDSILILAILRKIAPDLEINTISVKFHASYDETVISSSIAEHFECNHHIMYVDNFFEHLPEAINVVNLPFWDLHWYSLAKYARTFSNVLIAGDGGDELFAGYSFRYQKFLSLANKSSSVNNKITSYLCCHERDWVPDQDKLFSKKLRFTWEKIYQIFEPYFKNNLDPLSQVLLADYNGKIKHNFSPLYSKIHNYLEINYAAPLISKSLVNLSASMPIATKYDQRQNIGKLPLRRLLHTYWPSNKHIVHKQGFSVDTVNLWKKSGMEICKNYLLNPRIVENNIISKQWINKHINKNPDEMDVRYINKFYGLLALEIWYGIFVTKDLSAQKKL